MTQFKAGNSISQGRPKGAKNKRSQFSDAMTAKALAQLENALNDGEQWAVETILKS